MVVMHGMVPTDCVDGACVIGKRFSDDVAVIWCVENSIKLRIAQAMQQLQQEHQVHVLVAPHQYLSLCAVWMAACG